MSELDPAGMNPATNDEDDSAATRDRIQSWLLGEGWQLSEKPYPDALWLLEAQDSAGRHLVVGQKRAKPDQIILEGAVALSDGHRQLFEQLEAQERQEILWELRFTLLSLGVEFQGVSDPVARVMIGQRIYFDALGKDLFLQRVSQVRNGIIATIWTFARRLNLALSTGDDDSSGVN